MEKKVLENKNETEIREFFNKEFEIILVRILTILNVPVDFPTILEELILSIPDEIYNEQCTEALYFINSNIKAHLDELIIFYKNLLNYEKSLSSKR